MHIDTLEASKRLKELGFEEPQAEGLAKLLSDLDVASATKDDLDNAEERLRTEMKAMEKRLTSNMQAMEGRLMTEIQETRSQIEETRSDLTRTVVATVAAGFAFLAVVIPLAIYFAG